MDITEVWVVVYVFVIERYLEKWSRENTRDQLMKRYQEIVKERPTNKGDEEDLNSLRIKDII